MVKGTSGMELAQRGDMRIVSATNLRSAVQLLVEQQADALIFDRPAIRYHLKNNPDLALRLAPFTLSEETYGFEINPDSPLARPWTSPSSNCNGRGRLKPLPIGCWIETKPQPSQPRGRWRRRASSNR